jgi:site-specific DNA-methyltransferase (adenine-specific)
MQKENKLYLGDCLEIMPQFETDSIDAIVTDPPYGLKFMNNKWDASVPSVEIWQECLRILKPGAFAFVMSSPRQDVLSRMIINISDAGFNTNFTSIYWAYNTGFPKAQNISKVLDKRAGTKQTVIGHYQAPDGRKRDYKTHANDSQKVFDIERKKFQAEGRPITTPATKEAKKFDGAYSGFQPKPAVEVVIVAMKPLSENTYIDQALKNGHGCTWLDRCRIPYANDAEIGRLEAKMSKHSVVGKDMFNGYLKKTAWQFDKKIGRFPTNIICENDSMDGSLEGEHYSRYFSLEAWFEKYISGLPQKIQNTFPFLITPKPSVREKERKLESEEKKTKHYGGKEHSFNANDFRPDGSRRKPVETRNIHPTIKPIKLMMWVIALGTQEGDIVLDPFMGSGTTPLAAKMTHRHYKGIELEKEFFDISVKRIDEAQSNFDKFL